MKLTQAAVTRFQIPNDKSDHIEFDDTMPGFGLRLRAGRPGKPPHRSFIVQYKTGAKHRRMNLGSAAKVTLETARTEAKVIFGKVATGQDPQAEKTVTKAEASNSLGTLIAAYLAAKKDTMRAKTYAGASYNLNVLLKPLHSLTVGAANRATIAAQVRTIAKENGLVSANRARASLSAMFRWAIGEGLCDSNPVTGTNKQEENKPRERSLTDAEAATVFTTAPGNDYGHIVRLLLLTGCRRTELGDLKRSEFDAGARTITLPPDRTKNGQAHVVPLCDEAMAILRSIPQRAERDYFFGSGKRGYSGWSKSKTALDKAAKIAKWTLHDLRRTVRTGLGMLGVAPHIAEATLNHLPPKLIRTYDKNKYEAEKRAALELWANHLAVAAAQASGANVTRLTRQS